MLNYIKKMVLIKKEYKLQMARTQALPTDYRLMFKCIHNYIWGLATGDGSDMLKAQHNLIEFFELSAADGKKALDITGENIIGFCDEFLLDTPKWTDNLDKKMNSKIMKFVKKQS